MTTNLWSVLTNYLTESMFFCELIAAFSPHANCGQMASAYTAADIRSDHVYNK